MSFQLLFMMRFETDSFPFVLLYLWYVLNIKKREKNITNIIFPRFSHISRGV